MGDDGPNRIMKMPPLWSTVRVNTLKRTMDEAKRRMESILNEQSERRRGGTRPRPEVQCHPVIPDLLVIRGSGPHLVEPVDKEMYVDINCGCAVMRGADIYAPGILGSNGNFSVGDIVSVYMDLDAKCKRGLKRAYEGNREFLGNGTTMVSRTDIFSSAIDGKPITGIGVLMTEPVWDNPRLDGAIIEDWGYVQNLPSIICGHVLDPQPNEMVLDMCAAPGGKSTHLATLMKDKGRLTCVDSSSNRVQELIRNADALSLRCIETYRMNALDLLNENAQPNSDPLKPSFQPETFDRVLLDAPCSCTGQRPRVKALTEKQRTSHVPQQRKLLKTAYKLLKRGGAMVYSTCSLEVEENENQIAWFLREHSDMELAHQGVLVGQEVKIGNHQAGVQKFDPRTFCSEAKLGQSGTDSEDHSRSYKKTCLTFDQDTIGFFIAKVKKDASSS